jgi:tripartite ATP-independent transporter DctP family solute receptor
VLDGTVGQSLLDELGKHGLKGLAYFENGWRALTNNKRPVRTPEDAKGLKLRSTPNPYHLQAFRLLGMNPSPLPISELYSALETRAFDAQEHPIPVLWSSKFYEVQKFLTVSNHAYSPIVAAMHKPKFDGLPPEHQRSSWTRRARRRPSPRPQHEGGAHPDRGPEEGGDAGRGRA